MDNEHTATLQSYGIQQHSVVNYAISLFSLNPHSNIKNVFFDLKWNFPGSSADYLDGTCYIYSANLSLTERIFYSYRNSELVGQNAIVHSGDQMTSTGGKHTITVNLPLLKDTVKHVVFVLSAYHTSTIANFKNPGFEMYDLNKKDQSLCSYHVPNANKQALILCTFSRDAHNVWNVFQLGVHCSGNMKDDNQIVATILPCLRNLRI